MESPKKISWEGRSDIAGEAIGEEALRKAEKMAGELTLAEDTYRIREVNHVREVHHEADPFAPLQKTSEKAEEILGENSPLAETGLAQPPRAANDPRFDHFGTKVNTPVTPPPRKAYVPPPQPKSLLKRLFGG